MTLGRHIIDGLPNQTVVSCDVIGRANASQPWLVNNVRLDCVGVWFNNFISVAKCVDHTSWQRCINVKHVLLWNSMKCIMIINGVTRLYKITSFDHVYGWVIIDLKWGGCIDKINCIDSVAMFISGITNIGICTIHIYIMLQ